MIDICSGALLACWADWTILSQWSRPRDS